MIWIYYEIGSHCEALSNHLCVLSDSALKHLHALHDHHLCVLCGYHLHALHLTTATILHLYPNLHLS